MFSRGSLEMSATPCSIYHTVQSAFGANDLSALKGYRHADLRKKIDAVSKSTVEQLLDAISIARTQFK